MKKFLSLMLAVILLSMPLCVQSHASETGVNYDDLVAPCYENINLIAADIAKGSLGFVNCFSKFISLETNKTFVLTCYLQRTDGTYAWENYKSKSETYSSSGSFSIEKNWFAPAGYDYRVYTKLQVKNSAGTVVETATITSKVLCK